MNQIKRFFVVLLILFLIGNCAVPASALEPGWVEEFATFRQISRGSSHTGYVKALQRFLYCYPSTKTTIKNGGGVDGSFGTATETAVKTFQIAEWPHDEKQWDGVVGAKTWSRIGVRLSCEGYGGYEDFLYLNKQVIYVDTRAEGESYYNYNESINGTVYIDTFFHEGSTP